MSLGYTKSRYGMMAQKLGMTRIYIERKAVPVTLLKLPKTYVLEKKIMENYAVLKLGTEEYRATIKNPQKKELEKQNLPLATLVKEFKMDIAEAEKYNKGDLFDSSWLEIGQLIDVRSKSIGKGFAGAMKLWNFSGTQASHGASLSHRSIGSTGTRDKIFKQRKMPGRMGQENITIQSQKIAFKDEELNVVGLFGTVPGKSGTWVKVMKAIKVKS